MAMNTFHNIGNSAYKATNSALGSVSDFATGTLPATTTKALNSVVEFATLTVPATATTAINSAIDAINSAATSTLNTMSNAVPSSLLPFSMNATTPSKSNTTLSKNNSNITKNNSNFGMFNNLNMNSKTNNSANNTANNSANNINFPVIVFLFLVGILTLIFIVFKNEIYLAYQYIVVSVRKIFGINTSDTTGTGIKTPSVISNISKSPDTYLDKQYTKDQDEHSIIEKILPLGANEVFNVSSNDYNYYDAEPLCQALGAELANYDQVKQAWQKGADWCNYGWVKGQVAIYPTQQSTWEKLQHGPNDERNACGQPGVNGGYFDNPEMKFGVNCYGVKPDQSANDERVLMQNGSIPKTVSALKVDQKIQEVKNNIDMLGVLPFNTDKWASS